MKFLLRILIPSNQGFLFSSYLFCSLNPMLDVGQVQGAFMMGVGLNLTEQLIYDNETAQLVTSGTWVIIISSISLISHSIDQVNWCVRRSTSPHLFLIFPLYSIQLCFPMPPIPLAFLDRKVSRFTNLRIELLKQLCSCVTNCSEW
jgi:hypothetical protein